MIAVPQNHFWAGSACNPDYPKGVTAISDVLTIKADLKSDTKKLLDDLYA